MYVIGGQSFLSIVRESYVLISTAAYYPPSHALLNSLPPPTFDALLELADLANLGNLGAIGLAMGGLGSRAATVSKEQITKSKLIVVKAKDLVVWTPKEGEKEPESDTKGTAVRDNCIERVRQNLICGNRLILMHPAVLDLPGCIRARRRCTRYELPSCLP